MTPYLATLVKRLCHNVSPDGMCAIQLEAATALESLAAENALIAQALKQSTERLEQEYERARYWTDKAAMFLERAETAEGERQEALDQRDAEKHAHDAELIQLFGRIHEAESEQNALRLKIDSMHSSDWHKDAERYRWCRANWYQAVAIVPLDGSWKRIEALDARIDAAREGK